MKGKVVGKPEIYVDSNTPANGYITFLLGDVFDYDAFSPSTSEDFDTYESRVKNMGYHISSYIDEMSAIRQQSDNILLAVGDGQDVAASIQLFKNVGTSGSKIVLDANSVKINGGLTATAITAASTYINEVVAGSVTAEELNTGTESGMNIHIEKGMLDIMSGSTRRAAFGLNDQGEVILSFYDANGKEIYNLGPSGWNHV